jgi:hypothetical protein
MRLRQGLGVIAALSVSSGIGSGQAASNTVAAAAMKRIVNQFAGTWDITEQVSDGQIVRGSENWYANASGIPLIEEYHAKSATGEDLFDTAMLWWDASTNRYHGRWCADFVDEGCTSFSVRWSAERVEMIGAYTQGGKPVTWRELFVFDTPTSFTQTLRIGPRQKLVSTILATRVKAQASAQH